MYNEQIKLQYLEESQNRNINLNVVGERLFRSIGRYETELNKDCCEFTINEIIVYYQRRSSTSLESLNSINSLLRGYTNWCLSNNMVTDNQNHYNEVTHELIMSCLNYGIVMDKIISRKDLLHQIDSFPNVSDQALLLALFEGICGENMNDLVTLNCDNLSGNVFTLASGKQIEVSDELIELCRKSQDTYEYQMKNEYVSKLRRDDAGVFKNMDNSYSNNVSRKTLYNKLVRAKDYLGLNLLTTASLFESGRIEMIRNIMNTDGKTLDEVLSSKVTEERYGRIISYKQWKLKYEEYV